MSQPLLLLSLQVSSMCGNVSLLIGDWKKNETFYITGWLYLLVESSEVCRVVFQLPLSISLLVPNKDSATFLYTTNPKPQTPIAFCFIHITY